MNPMDIYVEKQSVEQLLAGDMKQFLLLYESYFYELYKYVKRRVSDTGEVERIVRLTILDAFGRIKETPSDISFAVWLYSIAKPRIWNYIDKSKVESVSLLDFSELNESADREFFVNVDKMFKKLSLEEKEILILKFIEEVSDGDVMAILNVDSEKLGARIYRVFKRADLLLFGGSEEKTDVYFGGLSSAMSAVKENENIVVPEVLKLNIRSELSSKIDSKDFGVDVAVVEEGNEQNENNKLREAMLKNINSGSEDPAKVFVDAANVLSQHEREIKYEERKRNLEYEQTEAERMEQKKIDMLDFFDQWKGLFAIIPLFLLFFVGGFLIFKYVDFSSWFSKSSCSINVVYNDIDADSQKNIDKYISDRICEHFEVKDLIISKVDESLNVEVNIDEWNMQYNWQTRGTDAWYIQDFQRTVQNADKIVRISKI